MNRIIFLLLVFISSQSFSQNPYILEWEKTYGGNLTDELNHVQRTSDGHYLLGGSTYSNNLDVQSGNKGGFDYWLIKIDDLGNIIWEKTYGGSNNEIMNFIQPTDDNGYFLGGITQSNDGDIQSGNFGNWEYWLVKIDKNGTIQWEKTFGGSSEDELKCIRKTDDGNYLLGGYSSSNDGDVLSGTQGSWDYWLIKIDGSGNIIWEKTYGGSDQESLYYIQSMNDSCFLLGGFSRSNNGDIKSGNHGEDDYWLVKIDKDGIIQWEKTYGGSSGEWITYIEPTNDNGFLLGGWTRSENGDIQNGFYQWEDFWVVKIDQEGVLQWEQTYGGNSHEQLYSIKSTNDGGFLLGGNYYENFWIIKINNQGVKKWDKTYGGSQMERLKSISSLTEDGFVVGGTTFSNNGDIQSGNKGNGDFWIINLIPNSPPTNIILSDSMIMENEPSGTEISMITTLDNDIDDTFIYSLVSGIGSEDNSTFQIEGNKLLSNTVFDYESKTSYSLRLQTKDSEGNTYSKSFLITINNVNDLRIENITIEEPFCENSPTGSIEYEVKEYVPPLTFNWSSGNTTHNLYGCISGTYMVIITDGENMTFLQEFKILPKPIFDGSSICYITSDGESNVINVDKGLNNYNVEKYVFYREGVSQNDYEKIGEINSTEFFFIDSLINNRTQSFSYKVSMIDSCGNESSLSSNHSTIHLSQNRGTSGEVNLYWTHYVGLNVPSYSIYRQKGNQDFEILKQISTNNNTYTDFTSNPTFNYQYYISFLLEDTCYTEINLKSGERLEVKSNTVSTDSTSTGIQSFIDSDYKVYPNPVSDKLIIETNNSHQLEVRIFDVNGNQIMNRNLLGSKNEINIKNVQSGVYFVKLMEDNTVVHQQKIVKY